MSPLLGGLRLRFDLGDSLGLDRPLLHSFSTCLKLVPSERSEINDSPGAPRLKSCRRSSQSTISDIDITAHLQLRFSSFRLPPGSFAQGIMLKTHSFQLLLCILGKSALFKCLGKKSPEAPQTRSYRKFLWSTISGVYNTAHL